MVGRGECGDIRVQGGVTNGVDNVLWNKILKRVQTKKGQNNLVHTSTQNFSELINILKILNILVFKYWMIVL